MSDVYNPESLIYEQLATLQLEACGLARKRVTVAQCAERDLIDQQLRRVEGVIEQLRRRLTLRSK
ncbi:MAG: hypothetical protein NTW19_08545 [Planctomycetota bacterium]|nr:hypothetical protein [Planctomycetota bacterium]